MNRMSEKGDLFPFGYGRAWSEPKASGIARLLQIGREPATRKTWYWAAGLMVVGYMVILAIIAVLS